LDKHGLEDFPHCLQYVQQKTFYMPRRMCISSDVKILYTYFNSSRVTHPTPPPGGLLLSISLVQQKCQYVLTIMPKDGIFFSHVNRNTVIAIAANYKVLPHQTFFLQKASTTKSKQIMSKQMKWNKSKNFTSTS
jgi:hypothetical protein